MKPVEDSAVAQSEDANTVPADVARSPLSPAEQARAAGFVWWFDLWEASPATLRIQGWCATPASAIRAMQLRLHTSQGTESVDLGYGIERADVHAAHPALPLHCGFACHIGTAYYVRRATLVALLDDGAERVIDDLPLAFRWIPPESTAAQDFLKRVLHPAAWAAREAGFGWSVDEFSVSPNALLLQGWVGHPSREIACVEVRLQGMDDAYRTLAVPHGSARADVAQDHPGMPAEVGMRLYTANEQMVRRAELWAHPADGEAVLLDVIYQVDQTVDAVALAARAASRERKQARERRLAEARSRHPLRTRWAELCNDLIKPWIRGKGRRRLPEPGWGEDTLDATQQAPDLFVAAVGWDAVLIVDHELGGGANLYRRILIEEARAAGRNVAVWTFSLSTLRYRFELHRQDKPVRSAWVTPELWDALRESGRVRDVYFNNCVSFPEPGRIADMLWQFARKPWVRLTIYVHDFHVVCPSSFLLNAEGQYCDVPTIEQCRSCLPRNNQQLVQLYPSRDIDAWRAGWERTLSAAHAIVCFSENSRLLLHKAYPTLLPRDIQVRPHTVPPLPGRHVYPREAETLNLAVVGSIGPHKGSALILKMAERIVARGLPVQIHVIGTLNTPHASPVIHETGPYRRDDLAQLLNQRAVQIALMPSICPETFSFVTHELKVLGAPIAAFDLGAQGDAVQSYAHGKVIGRDVLARGADAVLDQLLAFKAELDARIPPAPSSHAGFLNQ